MSDSAEDDIEKAIQNYRDVVIMISRETRPALWAGATRGLANAYQKRVRGDRAENVAFALKNFHDALTVYELTSWPREHIETQFDSAMLLFRECRWEESANAFQAALKAHTLLYRAASTPEARQAEPREVRGVPGALAYALAKIQNFSEAVLSWRMVGHGQSKNSWLSRKLR